MQKLKNAMKRWCWLCIVVGAPVLEWSRRRCAGQFVLAITVNVQPLHAIAPGPVRPVSLWASALVTGVNLNSFDRAAGKRPCNGSLADVFKLVGVFYFRHVLKPLREFCAI